MNLKYEEIRVRLGGRDILKDVSLEAAHGLMTGIAGPNGCGKSTLVKTTFGIRRPVRGRIRAGETDLTGLSPKRLASLISYVGQDAGCVFDFTVSDVVSMGLYARTAESGGRSGQELVDMALEDLHISHLKTRSILSLSGGERKLALIARAVVQGTETIILDEPTNHLDIRHQLFLLDYLKKTGKTVLIVLHDLRLASHYCDRLYLMQDGRVAACGTPEETLTEAAVRDVFGVGGAAARNAGGDMDFRLYFR